jgi:hypothetical protein
LGLYFWLISRAQWAPGENALFCPWRKQPFSNFSQMSVIFMLLRNAGEKAEIAGFKINQLVN